LMTSAYCHCSSFFLSSLYLLIHWIIDMALLDCLCYRWSSPLMYTWSDVSPPSLMITI
jgi:hypothetical protein